MALHVPFTRTFVHIIRRPLALDQAFDGPRVGWSGGAVKPLLAGCLGQRCCQLPTQRCAPQHEHHYNHHRPHRALASAAPLRALPQPLEPARVECLGIRRRDPAWRNPARVPTCRLTWVDVIFGTHRLSSRASTRCRGNRSQSRPRWGRELIRYLPIPFGIGTMRARQLVALGRSENRLRVTDEIRRQQTHRNPRAFSTAPAVAAVEYRF